MGADAGAGRQGWLRLRLRRLLLWVVLAGLAPIMPTASPWPIEEDDPPILTTVASWDWLRQSVTDPTVLKLLEGSVTGMPLVALSTKSGSSGGVDCVCVRFHFQTVGGSSTLRVYSRAEGSVYGPAVSRIDGGAPPIPQDDGPIAPDTQSLSAFVFLLGHGPLSEQVRSLLPQYALRSISLRDLQPPSEGVQSFAFSFIFEAVSACSRSPIRLNATVIESIPGNWTVTEIRLLHGEDARG